MLYRTTVNAFFNSRNHSQFTSGCKPNLGTAKENKQDHLVWWLVVPFYFVPVDLMWLTAAPGSNSKEFRNLSMVPGFTFSAGAPASGRPPGAARERERDICAAREAFIGTLQFS